MTTGFNPLGAFVVDAPLNDGALAEGKKFLAGLPNCAPGDFDHIYGHWTVGHYDQNFPDYNASIRYDGQHFSIDQSHDPRDNARSTFNNDYYAAHTYMRNTGGFGISTDDMAGASVHNYGTEPVTQLTLEYLCAAIGAAALKYNIDLAGTTPESAAPYANEPTFQTHAIAAMTVGSPPQYENYGITGTSERWDLASFIALPDDVALTEEMAQTCSQALAQRARLYKQALAA